MSRLSREAGSCSRVGRTRCCDLVIKATEPGKVFLDDGEIGVVPLDLPRIQAGSHVVRVAFDGGGSSSHDVLVVPDQTTEITVEPSEAAKAFHFRRGVPAGVTAGARVSALQVRDGGVRIAPFVNIGVSPGVDLRVAPVFVFGHGELEGEDPGFAFQLGAVASFRLNLGSVYTLSPEAKWPRLRQGCDWRGRWLGSMRAVGRDGRYLSGGTRCGVPRLRRRAMRSSIEGAIGVPQSRADRSRLPSPRSMHQRRHVQCPPPRSQRP